LNAAKAASGTIATANHMRMAYTDVPVTVIPWALSLSSRYLPLADLDHVRLQGLCARYFAAALPSAAASTSATRNTGPPA
jgi:hypothetical protein